MASASERKKIFLGGTPKRSPKTVKNNEIRTVWNNITMVCSGVFGILENGGLGHGEHMEYEPITGVWGQSPQWGPGASPPEAGYILRSKSSISAVNIHDCAIFSNVCMTPLMKQTW